MRNEGQSGRTVGSGAGGGLMRVLASDNSLTG